MLNLLAIWPKTLLLFINMTIK